MSTHSFNQAKALTLDLAEKKLKHVAIVIDEAITSDPSYPVDSGILKVSQSVKVERGKNTITITWFNTQFYAPFVHQGTGIHAIDGNGRKTPWSYTARIKGKLMKVWTRGSKPQRFIEKHTTDNRHRIEELEREV